MQMQTMSLNDCIYLYLYKTCIKQVLYSVTYTYT